jgi:hypothetical protein
VTSLSVVKTSSIVPSISSDGSCGYSTAPRPRPFHPDPHPFRPNPHPPHLVRSLRLSVPLFSLRRRLESAALLDVPPSPITERLPTTSTPSTVSSIPYTESALPASAPPHPVDSESTYDSTVLQASSPSVTSAPLYQGPDTSFNTSFFRRRLYRL